jgi:hypothetical protein
VSWRYCARVQALALAAAASTPTPAVLTHDGNVWRQGKAVAVNLEHRSIRQPGVVQSSRMATPVGSSLPKRGCTARRGERLQQPSRLQVCCNTQSLRCCLRIVASQLTAVLSCSAWLMLTYQRVSFLPMFRCAVLFCDRIVCRNVALFAATSRKEGHEKRTDTNFLLSR